ncbi:hypothetical protein BDK51DRAFT_51762 [Blyttiomyces helicus]|uniref:Uncharacterized protein n=1 Tax=Blyttiomyces helicus TaxID=388810 RepID=A0A4P9WIC3_9FUNG|nr:hypothetical protein BDK51DRAFT_51762 [Blyttiomyces helicus]|eukprot:RKO90306.1 hypothetical protein BDK51DRAFT_51762 [Blyttiomyces helicus]
MPAQRHKRATAAGKRVMIFIMGYPPQDTLGPANGIFPSKEGGAAASDVAVLLLVGRSGEACLRTSTQSAPCAGAPSCAVSCVRRNGGNGAKANKRTRLRRVRPDLSASLRQRPFTCVDPECGQSSVKSRQRSGGHMYGTRYSGYLPANGPSASPSRTSALPSDPISALHYDQFSILMPVNPNMRFFLIALLFALGLLNVEAIPVINDNVGRDILVNTEPVMALNQAPKSSSKSLRKYLTKHDDLYRREFPVFSRHISRVAGSPQRT